LRARHLDELLRGLVVLADIDARGGERFANLGLEQVRLRAVGAKFACLDEDRDRARQVRGDRSARRVREHGGEDVTRRSEARVGAQGRVELAEARRRRAAGEEDVGGFRHLGEQQHRHALRDREPLREVAGLEERAHRLVAAECVPVVPARDLRDAGCRWRAARDELAHVVDEPAQVGRRALADRRRGDVALRAQRDDEARVARARAAIELEDVVLRIVKLGGAVAGTDDRDRAWIAELARRRHADHDRDVRAALLERGGQAGALCAIDGGQERAGLIPGGREELQALTWIGERAGEGERVVEELIGQGFVRKSVTVRARHSFSVYVRPRRETPLELFRARRRCFGSADAPSVLRPPTRS
jgi:hypothetical protein